MTFELTKLVENPNPKEVMDIPDKKRILWIEDDYRRLESLVDPLREAGYKIVIADTCDEAEKILKACNKWALIIWDFRISKEKGMPPDQRLGIRLLKECSAKIDAPIIAISVVAANNLDEKTVECVDEILTKGDLRPSFFYEIAKRYL